MGATALIPGGQTGLPKVWNFGTIRNLIPLDILMHLNNLLSLGLCDSAFVFTIVVTNYNHFNVIVNVTLVIKHI